MTEELPTNALIFAFVGTDHVGNEFNVSHFLEAIRCELLRLDELSILSSEQFVVSMKETSESDALRMARLVRNAFQQTTNASLHSALAIGVVLFGSQFRDDVEVRNAARRLAVKAYESAYKSIELVTLQA